MKTVKRLFFFYYEGFRNMTTGRSLWIIILVKLIVIFLVIKLFFFPDFLGTKMSNDKDRSDYVIKELTKTNK